MTVLAGFGSPYILPYLSPLFIIPPNNELLL